MLEAFCLEYYGSAPSVPPQIVVPRDAGDLSALAEFLSERRGAQVEVRVRGARREAAASGARRRERAACARHRSGGDRAEAARRVEALEELREALNLESLPIRIECYDISHAMGQDPVGSMVVFQDGDAEEVRLPQVRDQDGERRTRTTSRRWRR